MSQVVGVERAGIDPKWIFRALLRGRVPAGQSQLTQLGHSMKLEDQGIYLHSKWQALRGIGYGLKQPTMTGLLRVVLSPDYRFTDLDEIMNSLLDEPVPASDRPMDASGLLVHRLFHWHASAQRHQKIPVFGSYFSTPIKAVSPDSGSTFFVALPYFAPQASVDSLGSIRKILNNILCKAVCSPEDLSQIHTDFEKLLENLKKYSLEGINSFHLLCAANVLDIPIKAVEKGTFCFGSGAKSRWLRSTITDKTPSLGVGIASRKSRTAYILGLNGVPVPLHCLASSETQALEIANRLGYPVVIKPDDQEQGRGVESGLLNDASLLAAYRAAAKYSSRILVEKHHEGEDYRLTVFQNRVIKIIHRRAGGVVGDGSQSIDELVKRQQQTPRFQKIFRQSGRVLLVLDDEASGMLSERGLTPQSVPLPGEFICLRRKSNISAGGIQTLIPIPNAHPDNIQLAVRATRAVHLDLCGVDLLIPDIATSWLKTGAVIIEMNSQPQIGINTAPEVYAMILQEVLQGDGRIPIHLLICATESVCPETDEALRFMKEWNCNGLSMSQGVWVDGIRVVGKIANGFDAARILLLNDTVSAAACVMTAQEILHNGLPADRFERVTVVLQARGTGDENAVLQKAVEMTRRNARDVLFIKQQGSIESMGPENPGKR